MEQDVRFEASLTEDGRYRLLVESVTDYAIYMLDIDGRVSSWNPGAARFKGYQTQEILGEHFSRFYTEEDKQAGLPKRALETAAGEGRFENEGWRVRKDGSRFWANVVIDPILDRNKNLVGYAKVTRDLTERRNSQMALDEAREALIQAQKMEAVGQLTGGIAHDFNNLLMAILGSLEMLRKRLPDDPRSVALVDNAVQGAQRGAALTQRMLAFARRQDLAPKPLDVPELVRSMALLLQSSVGQTVTIETFFPLTLRAAQADSHQLELALLNLFVNARDAMPEGGPVTIAANEEILAKGNPLRLKPGSYIRLSVTDKGLGMDEATLARAQEPFYTTKGVGKGTGLGLSMVHGFAEQSGGRLILKSQKGLGTQAEIWLPAAGTGADEGGVLAPAQEVAWAATGSLGVLAVDDDVLVRMNTVMMLEDLGHSVREANSAKEALRILQEEGRIDLVITDHAMPHMTGSQLAAEVRAHWPATPIILATGYAELPPGGDEQLPKLLKPFSQEDLKKAIAHVTKLPRRGA